MSVPVPLATRPPVRPLAVVLLIVGIAAVLTSLIPWVGLVIGVIGIVLFVVSRVLKTPGLLAAFGGVLAILGAGANVLIILLVTFVFPAIGSYVAHGGYDDGAGENSKYDEDYDLSSDYLIETPCFSFSGPEGWINKQSDAFDVDCMANLVDHGGLDADGRYHFGASYGNVYGYVSVTPVSDPVSAAADSQSIELDGVTGTIEYSALDSELPVATIRIVMPEQHTNYYGDFQSLTITIAENPEGLDALVDQVADHWKWN